MRVVPLFRRSWGEPHNLVKKILKHLRFYMSQVTPVDLEIERVLEVIAEQFCADPTIQILCEQFSQ